MSKKIISSVEEYRYYAAGAGDIRPLSLGVVAIRITEFRRVHKQEMRNRILLAGGKPK